jgi:hypothetical protein
MSTVADRRGSRAPEKLDLRRELKHLYTARSAKPALVEVPRMQFLALDGVGLPQPEGGEFQEGIAALYTAAYALKFAYRAGSRPIDYPVMPLEALWWSESGDLRLDRPETWRWSLMIMEPDFVTPEAADLAVAQARQRRPNSHLDRVELRSFEEGTCAQVLHLGPYDAEGPTIKLLSEFIASQGLHPRGKHHEIYLSDPRRSAPERIRTILRQPVT